MATDRTTPVSSLSWLRRRARVADLMDPPLKTKKEKEITTSSFWFFRLTLSCRLTRWRGSCWSATEVELCDESIGLLSGFIAAKALLGCAKRATQLHIEVFVCIKLPLNDWDEIFSEAGLSCASIELRGALISWSSTPLRDGISDGTSSGSYAVPESMQRLMYVAFHLAYFLVIRIVINWTN